MRKFLKPKIVLTLVACIITVSIVTLSFSGSLIRVHAASRSSHNIAYITYDDSGFTGASIPSGNIFSDAIIGGPAPTIAVTDPVTYNGMIFTPMARAALSATTLAPYDTLILFEVCDIGTSLTASQHAAINAYLAAGNKIILYDADRCAAGEGGVADYSWFTYPFATSSPGPQGASGTLTVVENSSLTQGLASDPFNSDELGDANTATTSDPHWFAAAKTTNTLGNNGYFLAYARNTGLIIYDGADHWFTSAPTQSLTDLFLNELNQQYDPDNLPSTVPIASVNYFALGDSFSSGEGNPPFMSGTDGPTDFCHRSSQAYSQVLGTTLGLQPKFYACSGAVTQDVTNLNIIYNSEPAQLLDLPTNVNATFGLATMTIGGNDAGFADVLKSCISHRLLASTYNAALRAKFGPVADWLGLTVDPSCAHSPTFVNAENKRIATTVMPAVKQTYMDLLSHVSQTDTSVIVADYPHLFPDSSKEQSCLQLAPFLTTADQQYFNAAGDQLDSVLATAASQAGVNFVDVRPTFAGHGVCGNGGAWINGVSLASSKGCTFSVAGKCIIPNSPAIGSFHPNASGQASGYATAFDNYIKSATNHTVEGYPANPPAAPTALSVALPNVTTAATTATDAVQTLTVQPVTAMTADCEGTYTAGQQVSVSGSGFAPNVSVRLYVTSKGLKPAGQQQVGLLTADATGSVSGTIRIPSAATGFTPSGSTAGLTFVDAIGTGPGGVHTDDIAMVGLAVPGSACSTVTHLPFKGFEAPVANFPHVNIVHPGASIPLKFDLPGIHATINDVLASGYPQSAPVSCSNPALLTTGDPTVSAKGSPSGYLNNDYIYQWKTNASWRGCREFIMKLVDGSYHQAVFDFRTGR